MNQQGMKTARFWVRRILRRAFLVGIYRRLREAINQPRVHRRLAQASAQKGQAFTVVQIGAHDGQLLDPLSPLVHRYGWSGVLVEPNPHNVEKLRETYRHCPQIRIEPCAITERDGTATLYRPIAMPGGRPNPFLGQESLKPEHFQALAWIDEDWPQLVEAIEVPSLSLATLLHKHGIAEVDFFLTDTEGYDKVILDQLEATGLRPRFLQFEYINMSGGELTELKDRLRRQGYRWLGLRWDLFAFRE